MNRIFRSLLLVFLTLLFGLILYFYGGYVRDRESMRPLSPLHESNPPLMPGYGAKELTPRGIITLTNKVRGEVDGLPPLAENEQLNNVAAARLQDMFEKQYFAHNSPSGDDVSDVAQRVGYRYKIIAENIAQGGFKDDQRIVNGWLQSPGHRKNILSGEVTEIGVAVARGMFKGQETWVGVQVFGLPSLPDHADAGRSREKQNCTQPSASMAGAIETGKTEISRLQSTIDTMAQELARLKEDIENSRRRRYNDQALVRDHSAKVQTYNQMVEEAKGKNDMLQNMIEAYNRDVKTYNECMQSSR
jgi:hypothetical protein